MFEVLMLVKVVTAVEGLHTQTGCGAERRIATGRRDDGGIHRTRHERRQFSHHAAARPGVIGAGGACRAQQSCVYVAAKGIDGE